MIKVLVKLNVIFRFRSGLQSFNLYFLMLIYLTLICWFTGDIRTYRILCYIAMDIRIDLYHLFSVLLGERRTYHLHTMLSGAFSIIAFHWIISHSI